MPRTSPLERTINVTRWLGPTDGDDHLLDIYQLVNRGLLDRDAVLEIAAWESTTNPILVVEFNGEDIGELTFGPPPHISTFRIPIQKLKWPAERGTLDRQFNSTTQRWEYSGEAPIPKANVVTIRPLQSGQEFCVNIKSIMVSIVAASPIELIHGNSVTSGYFTRQGFEATAIDLGYQVDGLIQMTPNQDRTANNAQKIAHQLPQVLKTLGATKVHLVAHSKGGLDSRRFLGSLYRPSSQLTVLSLTGIGVPHNGSPLADLMWAKNECVRKHALVHFNNLGIIRDTLMAWYGTPNDGYEDLQTFICEGANTTEISRLPQSTSYFSVAADADRNASASLDTYVEYAGLDLEDRFVQWLMAGFNEWTIGRSLDMPYQFLRGYRTVDVTMEPVEYGSGQNSGVRWVATVTGLPHITPSEGNDLLVPLESGLGAFSYETITSASYIFYGANGRNHANIGDGVAAGVVIPWLRQSERR